MLPEGGIVAVPAGFDSHVLWGTSPSAAKYRKPTQATSQRFYSDNESCTAETFYRSNACRFRPLGIRRKIGRIIAKVGGKS